MSRQRLIDLAEGEKATVIALDGGGCCAKRLVSIGVRPGCRLEIISKGHGGKMILHTSLGRIALGHGMAEKVIVNS